MPPPPPLRLRTRRTVRAFVDLAGLVGMLIGFLLTHDLVKATWFLVAGSAIGLVVGWIAERRIAPIPLVAGGAALVFGGLTLIFHDARFVKAKPTFMNIAFATFLLGGTLMNRNPLKILMGEALEMSDAAWRTLTIRYGVFFIVVAILNLVVWWIASASFPPVKADSVWLLFRFPGLMILTVIFTASQLPLMMRHAKTEDSEPPAPPA
jgi:intracellular septation protein